MKKTLTVLSAMLVITGVFASQSLAHGGRGHHFGWHQNNHAQIWRGVLTAPTGATGSTEPTSSVARIAHHLNKTGGKLGHKSVTGPIGYAQWVQNKNNYHLGVKVWGLTPSTTYNVAIYTDADGQGCASTTNTALAAPAIPAIVTNTKGGGKTRADGPRSEAGLDPAAGDYVKVSDSTGATVLCGSLTLKGKRGHGHGHGGCGSTGGTGATGDSGATGDVDSRSHGHRH